jgi:transcriptional regulator with XRE-family HTH domain
VLAMAAVFNGAKLRELREAAGSSQDELARLAGVSQQGVAHWEAGEREPRYGAAAALAKALGVGVEVFLADPAGPKRRRRKK